MKHPQKILQVVPRLAPDMDGVGEYSLKLSQTLKANHQIDSAFLVIRPSDKLQPVVAGFDVYGLDVHTVDAFVDTVPDDVSAVVLQYSNYPYLQGKLDTPMWLGVAMKALRKKGLLTLVMFHELPTLKYGIVSLPNPIQQRLSRDLAKDADVVVTNNEAFQETLAGWTPKPVHCLPNFAPIGEPARVLPLSERDRSMIVFGSSDRRRVYQSNIQMLKEICEGLSIHTLYDVGKTLAWDPSQLAPVVKTIKTGMLPDTEVSAIMDNCIAGIFDYHRFPRNLGKSSVYAAYCAHGLLPICNGRFLRPQDGIIANEHYVDSFTIHERSQSLSQSSLQQPSLDAWLQEIATNAHNLYLTHSLDRCAQKYAKLISLS